MSENANGAPPRGPPIPTDVGIGLMHIELAQHMLVGMVAQLLKCGGQSPALQEVARVLDSMAQHLVAQRAEILRQVASGIVVASPGDVPPRRLQ